MPLTSPRASSRGFLVAPLRWSEAHFEEWVRNATGILNGLLDGKHNATGTVTITASAATTTISDRRIGRETRVFVMPTTANAAAELATLYQTFPNANVDAAVLNHANNAQTDRDFVYVLAG